MTTLPESTKYVKLSAHSHRRTSLAATLAALAYCATTQPPTFAGWYVLHTRWREIEAACIGDKELATMHARVDALLGGFGSFRPSSGSDSLNVKGKFSDGSMSENFLRSGSPLTGRSQSKISTVRLKGRQLGRSTELPSGERQHLIGGLAS